MPTIRKATAADLAAVLQWLEAEHIATGEGFWVNRGVVADARKKNRLSVIDVGGDVLGFLADAREGPNILEIRPDARGNGHGEKLALAAIEAARKRKINVMKIECAPSTSVPFWQKMGFTPYHQSGSSFSVPAYRILDRTAKLGVGPRVAFRIGFFEEQDFHANRAAFRSYEGDGQQRADGSIRLPERALAFNPGREQSSDYVVRVEAGGKVLHAGRVKYEVPKALGAKKDPSGYYYFDYILPQVPASPGL